MDDHRFASGYALIGIGGVGQQTGQYIVKNKLSDYNCQIKTSGYIHPVDYYQDNQFVLLDDCEKIPSLKAGTLTITNTYVKSKGTFILSPSTATPTEISYSKYLYPAIGSSYTTFNYTCDKPLDASFNAMGIIHNFITDINLEFHASAMSGQEIDRSGSGSIKYVSSVFNIKLNKSGEYTVVDKPTDSIIIPSTLSGIPSDASVAYNKSLRKIIYSFTLNENYTDKILIGDTGYHIVVKVNNNI